ncbi:hypothetical protein [Gillisia hiemivivida]|nr:hypothetical protein [Gillisia hiemivivida]
MELLEFSIRIGLVRLSALLVVASADLHQKRTLKSITTSATN